jgi:LuxR family transcriptional regulator, quorum-sensing system regulator BjaR1
VSMWGDVQEFTGRAGAATSVSEINHAFGQMVETWGFETFVAIQISSNQLGLRAPLVRSFGKPNVLWLNRYKQAGYIRRDPAVVNLMKSTNPFWWSEIQSNHLELDQKMIFGEAEDLGIVHGLVVPVRLPDGSVWSCGLGASHIDESEELKIAAVVAANYYVGRGVLLQSRADEYVDLAYRLTKRQREVVTLLAKGFSCHEIGNKLGTSERTVAHQVEDAKRRLNARTLAAVVSEAILQGEIILN